jgi:hypothetical protein
MVIDGDDVRWMGGLDAGETNRDEREGGRVTGKIYIAPPFSLTCLAEFASTSEFENDTLVSRSRSGLCLPSCQKLPDFDQAKGSSLGS